MYHCNFDMIIFYESYNMKKRVYISADYDFDSGDRNVVEELYKWSESNRYQVEFTDMAKVVSGSIANKPDCRICELKREFNSQINLSSIVICVIGDKTSQRTAGSECERVRKEQYECHCTPYKKNCLGSKTCFVSSTSTPGIEDDCGNINSWSYLRHEFEQAKKKGKQIIVVYNSLNKQPSWLPDYMSEYEDKAEPFWIYNWNVEKVGNYQFIKKALGYE